MTPLLSTAAAASTRAVPPLWRRSANCWQPSSPSRYAASRVGQLYQGKLPVLDGDPGCGKTRLALDMPARITAGRPFSDGSRAIGPAGVVNFTVEDDPADTLRPRFDAAGWGVAAGRNEVGKRRWRRPRRCCATCSPGRYVLEGGVRARRGTGASAWRR